MLVLHDSAKHLTVRTDNNMTPYCLPMQHLHCKTNEPWRDKKDLRKSSDVSGQINAKMNSNRWKRIKFVSNYAEWAYCDLFPISKTKNVFHLSNFLAKKFLWEKLSGKLRMWLFLRFSLSNFLILSQILSKESSKYLEIVRIWAQITLCICAV